MSKQFTYKGKEFLLDNTIKDGELKRCVIKIGTLGFPMLNYKEASEYLAEEYGGTPEEVLAVLNATEPLTGIKESDVVSKVAPSEIKTDVKTGVKGKKKSGGSKKTKKEKKAKAPKPEPVKMTFTLPDGAVTRTVQVKTVLPDQKPESTEDIKLTDTVGLHIDRYSARNRTAKLYKFNTEDGAPTPIVAKGKNEENPHEVDLIGNYDEVLGEVLIEKVSLMDAIYKFAEIEGMSFGQADKFIKIKRGLIPVPEKKQNKKPKVDLTKKGKKVPTEEETVDASAE